MNVYETDRLMDEYLLFHYGAPEEVLPWDCGPHGALGFAIRCVSECLDISRLPDQARGLDLGCAVGRSSFELSRYCSAVLGIDSSRRFIEAASTIQAKGKIAYSRVDEGELFTALQASVPEGVNSERVSFEVGDAMSLSPNIGMFDVVLMANLIDRLSDPRRCLNQLGGLLERGGQLIITSPYTWLDEFTPREQWLGGHVVAEGPLTTRAGLERALASAFRLNAVKQLPLLIREHARKYQWSVAEATLWERR